MLFVETMNCILNPAGVIHNSSCFSKMWITQKNHDSNWGIDEKVCMSSLDFICFSRMRLRMRYNDDDGVIPNNVGRDCLDNDFVLSISARSPGLGNWRCPREWTVPNEAQLWRYQESGLAEQLRGASISPPVLLTSFLARR